MQQSNTWKIRLTALSVASALTFTAHASDEAEAKKTDSTAETPADEKGIDLGGSLTLGYDTNIYDKDDYRSVRNITWSSSLSSSFKKNYSAYLSTGGYRALENETGDYFTDTVVGLSRSGLFSFGETGKVGLSGQLTIPTSEFSRKTDLHTALRLSAPVGITALDTRFTITPRLRKNFHEYKTSGNRALTEWVYSLSLAASYSWERLRFSTSLLGGNSISYYGTRRNDITYAGSASVKYRVNESLSFSFSAATSGVYADAEKGTLGNVDLFDDDKATYSASATFSF